MNGAASLVDAGLKLGDLLGQVLVLALDRFQVVDGLLARVLQLEQLGRGVACILLSGLELDLGLLLFLFGLSQQLVKVALLLVQAIDNRSSQSNQYNVH